MILLYILAYILIGVVTYFVSSFFLGVFNIDITMKEAIEEFEGGAVFFVLLLYPLFIAILWLLLASEALFSEDNGNIWGKLEDKIQNLGKDLTKKNKRTKDGKRNVQKSTKASR